jgi:hypothetical protein
MTDQAEEPLIEAHVERAVALYVGRLSPVAVDEMRRMLRLMLTTHPVAQGLLRRLRPRHVVESGETAVAGAADAARGAGK